MSHIDSMYARGARRAALAVAFGFALFAATATGRADDGSWVIVATQGQVQIEASGGMWTPVAASNVVQPGSFLRTGASGHVTVEHNGDRFVVAPNSQLELPKPTKVSLPEAHQAIGTVLYDMVPRGVPRFKVKTPYLAAVIKGTVFTVTVGGEGAAVHVTRGVVQVSSASGVSMTLVYPGQTALVSATAKDQVHLIGPNVTPANGNKSAMHAESATKGLKSVKADGSDAKIPQAIGPHAESIAALTQGLVPDAGKSGAAGALHGNGGVSNGNGNGNGGLAPNAVTGVGAGASSAIGLANGNGNGHSNGVGAVASAAVNAVGNAVGNSNANGNGNGNSGGGSGHGHGKP